MNTLIWNLWYLPFLLRCSNCLEELQQCYDGDCNKDQITNRYTSQSSAIGGHERDTQLDVSEVGTTEEPHISSNNNVYEIPPVKRLPPGSVGDAIEIHLEPGMLHRRITRATEPPIFEIPNFLSFEECDLIIQAAKTKSMKSSKLFGVQPSDAGKNLSEVIRISKGTLVKEKNVGPEFLKKLHGRLVVKYDPGGHYHAHSDSRNTSNVPCCFQKSCSDVKYTDQQSKCCRNCRFMTVLYYLNDVIQGGETAFPLADMPKGLLQEKMNDPQKAWKNLSHYCHNSSVVITPKKGTAIAWYNHFLDDKGYLGFSDHRSSHGGCDIIKGEKWIATNWISETTYHNRFEPSVYFDRK